MSRFFRDVWRGLLFALSLPLRIMTGRWQPDYARIRELELSCGLRAPDKVEQLAYRSLEVTASEHHARAGLPAPPVQLFMPGGHPLLRAAPATREPDDRPARSPRRHSAAWERDYEAGQAKTRAWLDSLPPVQGSDIRAYREQLGDWYNR